MCERAHHLVMEGDRLVSTLSPEMLFGNGKLLRIIFFVAFLRSPGECLLAFRLLFLFQLIENDPKNKKESLEMPEKESQGPWGALLEAFYSTTNAKAMAEERFRCSFVRLGCSFSRQWVPKGTPRGPPTR